MRKLFENVPPSIEALRHLYGETNFRVSDTHGAMVGLDVWYQYAATTDDDAPFAIYDAEFADLGGFAYDVPRFLSEDAFALANVDERPPWRWLLLGGPRSGTGVHVDPLYTHAWVYLVQGLKRWIFLPSNLSRDELRELGVGEPQLPSAQWFAKYRDAAAALPGTVELVQRPGELVYVPAGRPHAVLNLEWSYALTHNYAVLSDACVLSTSIEEPEFFDARGGRCRPKSAPHRAGVRGAGWDRGTRPLLLTRPRSHGRTVATRHLTPSPQPRAFYNEFSI